MCRSVDETRRISGFTFRHSSFLPTGKRDGWKAAAWPGAEAAVEILSYDFGRKRISVGVLEEGSVLAEGAHAAAPKGSALLPTSSARRCGRGRNRDA